MRKTYQVTAKLKGRGVIIEDIQASSANRAKYRLKLKLRAQGLLDFVHPEEVDELFEVKEV